jgi:hypothetical protein
MLVITQAGEVKNFEECSDSESVIGIAMEPGDTSYRVRCLISALRERVCAKANKEPGKGASE